MESGHTLGRVVLGKLVLGGWGSYGGYCSRDEECFQIEKNAL